MAIFEQRPDTARARPGDLFTKKNLELYGKLFDPATNINFYVACGQIQNLVNQYLKQAKLERALMNDIKFYVSMIVSVKATGKKRPGSEDLAKVNLSITDSVISDAYKMARQAYLHQGADQDASKGPEMLAEIKNELGIV
jgi:hypothetical protein